MGEDSGVGPPAHLLLGFRGAVPARMSHSVTAPAPRLLPCVRKGHPDPGPRCGWGPAGRLIPCFKAGPVRTQGGAQRRKHVWAEAGRPCNPASSQGRNPGPDRPATGSEQRRPSRHGPWRRDGSPCPLYCGRSLASPFPPLSSSIFSSMFSSLARCGPSHRWGRRPRKRESRPQTGESGAAAGGQQTPPGPSHKQRTASELQAASPPRAGLSPRVPRRPLGTQLRSPMGHGL